MRPIIAFPFHDPDLQIWPHLQAILPDLKALFSRAYICPPFNTRKHMEMMDWLAKDNFFTIIPLDQELQIGEHFAYLYMKAAQASDRNEIMHLAYVDRLSFALEGSFREQFMQDVRSISSAEVPFIFQRSTKAWQTHPQNYYEIESFVTTIGKNLFDQSLDYAWCHLVVKASHLLEIMPRVKNPDLSMVAEMVLWLQPDIRTREVDWLAWEDPFILSADPDGLRSSRENSVDETQKRLGYAIAMVQALLQHALALKEPH